MAKSKLTQHCKTICKEYTFGWGGPIEWAKEKFPYIKNSILDIDGNIPDLPVCVFQSRDLKPSEMIAVIPFISSDGNPTNTRVVPSCEISESTLKAVTEFSQAFLFLINTKGLSSPHKNKALTKELISLTDRRLIIA